MAILPIPPADAFRAGENGSTPMAAADNRLENGLGLLNVVDPFDPLKWDTFSSVGGDPDDGGDRDQVMSPIRSPPHKELSPTGEQHITVPQCWQ